MDTTGKKVNMGLCEHCGRQLEATVSPEEIQVCGGLARVETVCEACRDRVYEKWVTLHDYEAYEAGWVFGSPRRGE